MEGLLQLDGNILLWIQDFVRNPVLTPLMKGITHLGDHGLFWIVLTLGLLVFRKTRPVGIQCAIALVCSLLINNICLKNLVARTRPYEVVEGLELLVGRATDFSFPSGHSGASFAAAWVLLYRLPKQWGIPAVILAALIALSRLYVGIHYPTDVICGILTGILSACIAMALYRILEQRFRNPSDRPEE